MHRAYHVHVHVHVPSLLEAALLHLHRRTVELRCAAHAAHAAHAVMLGTQARALSAPPWVGQLDKLAVHLKCVGSQAGGVGSQAVTSVPVCAHLVLYQPVHVVVPRVVPHLHGCKGGCKGRCGGVGGARGCKASLSAALCLTHPLRLKLHCEVVARLFVVAQPCTAAISTAAHVAAHEADPHLGTRGCRLQAAGCKLQAWGCRLEHMRLQAGYTGLQAAVCGWGCRPRRGQGHTFSCVPHRSHAVPPSVLSSCTRHMAWACACACMPACIHA